MRRLLLVLMASLFAISLFAQTPVCGVIDGETWTPAGSPYIVECDLLIANLVIEPGVTVVANGNYEIKVTGIITAIGTEQDSIVFTKADGISGWKGIYFHFTTFASVLKYCRIEYSKDVHGGIRIWNSTPTIQNCTLLNNTRSTHGGGINIYNDTVVNSEFNLKGCVFINNKASQHGGALYIYLEGGNVILDSILFKGNISNPSPLINGNYVGGALYLSKGNATITNSLFVGNRSNSRCTGFYGCDVTARGGAVYIGSTGNAMIKNCVFQENKAHAQNDGNCTFGGSTKSFGGAVYVNAGTVSLTNCILDTNSTTWTDCVPSDGGGGLYVNGGSVTVTNCTIVRNLNATGVHRAGGTLEIMNSIIYYNNGEGTQVGGTVAIAYSCVQNGNTTQGNITGDPVFIDGLFHTSSISPCVDAGNPDTSFNDVCFPPSLGTERNDMGAYGGPGACGWIGPIITGIKDEIANIATQYSLGQNYPNPFNPSTTMTYELLKPEDVRLTVYNMLGQEIVTLVNERQTGGVYRVQWDGHNQEGMPAASGVYLYRLRAGEFTETRKMLLLR